MKHQPQTPGGGAFRKEGLRTSELTDKGIGVRQSFLKWALKAQRIDYNIDEQKNVISAVLSGLVK